MPLTQLKAELITPVAFAPYGQVITPSDDGKAFDGEDAQLQLEQGTPRFYIMRLHSRGCRFQRITRHVKCTQCLGSLQGKEWLIAVCPPDNRVDTPNLEAIKAFRIPGDRFIKLNPGTWHAGPYFTEPTIDFYNLELSDTNINDHFTHDFFQNQQLEFEILPS